MCFLRNAKLWREAVPLLVVSSLIVLQVHAVSQEKSAREMLTIGDAALSITGDVIAAKSDNSRRLAGGCRLAGSVCNMLGNAYNPCMPKDVKLVRLISDGARSLSHLTTICSKPQENSQNSGEKKKEYLASGILRLVSLGAEWFSIQKEYAGLQAYGDDENTKTWAVARLIASWSRALADGFSANGYGKALSYFSAMVDSYELMKELNLNVVGNNVIEEVHSSEREPVARPQRQRPQRPQTREEQLKQFFRNVDQNADFRRELAGLGNGEHAWLHCPICLSCENSRNERFKRKDIGMYPCGHFLCKKCIRRLRRSRDEWSKKCPVCQRNVRDNEIVN